MDDSPLTLKANVFWNSIGSIINLGCQWLITIFVVRLSTSYTDAGILALAMSICNIFTPFARYQMRTYQVSDVTHEHSAGEYMGFRLLTIALALIGCMGYSFITCQENTYLAIFLYLLYKAVDLVIDVMHGLDQQHLRMDYIGISQILRGPLALVGFSLVFYFTQNLDLGIASMVTVTIPVALFYDYPRASHFESLKPVLSKALAIKLLKACFPAVLAAILCSAILTIPRQYLSISFGDDALGIYSSVAAPVAIIQMGVNYLYYPLLGYFSDYYLKGEKRAFARLLVVVFVGVVVVALICVFAFKVFGEWVFGLFFGESILGYLYLINPLIVCAILTAVLWFVSDLLVSIRDFRGNLIGNIVAFICSLVFTLPIVTMYNMNGVSFVGIIAYSVGVLVLIGFLLYRVHSLTTDGLPAQ